MGKRLQVLFYLFLLIAMEIKAEEIVVFKSALDFEQEEPKATFEVTPNDTPYQADWIQPGAAGTQKAFEVKTKFTREKDVIAFRFSLPAESEAEGADLLHFWARGTDATAKVEVMLVDKQGAMYKRKVMLENTWKEYLTPLDTFINTASSAKLKPEALAQIRFCFWRGFVPMGQHSLALDEIGFARSESGDWEGKSQKEVIPYCGRMPELPPSADFTIESLDLFRGRWQFGTLLGTNLHYSEKIPLAAAWQPTEPRSEIKFGYLAAAPTRKMAYARVFPEPLVVAGKEAEGYFSIKEPFLTGVIHLKVEPKADAKMLCQAELLLKELGSAHDYLKSLFLVISTVNGEQILPLQLINPEADTRGIRVIPSRIGGSFEEGEKVAFDVIGHNLTAEAMQDEIAFEVTDYSTGQMIQEGKWELALDGDAVERLTFQLPWQKKGLFILRCQLVKSGQEAQTRFCYLPKQDLANLEPRDAMFGINVFWQQVPWYAYQPEIMGRAGIKWMRPWLNYENTWPVIEPNKGEYNWNYLDETFQQLAQAKQAYQFMFMWAPGWAAIKGGNYVAPEHYADWAEHVKKVVTRYQEQVQYWEVWNEPNLNGSWSPSSPDVAENVRVYIEHLKEAYKAVKGVDANAKVIAISAGGGPLPYTKEFARQGGLNYCDAISLHIYMPYPERGNYWAVLQEIKEVLAAHNAGHKEVWINELGTGAYDLYPDYAREVGYSEMQQANWNVRQAIMDLAFGYRSLWFCSYDPRNSEDKRQWTWDSGIGIYYLGYQPKLAYPAIAGLTYQLEGAKFVSKLTLGAQTWGMVFEKDGEAIICFWTEEGTENFELPLEEQEITLFDMFGNKRCLNAQGLTFLATESPQYIRGVKLDYLRYAIGLEKLIKLSAEKQELNPGEKVSFKLDLSAIDLPVEGKLSIEVPQGWQSPSEVAFNEKQLSFQVQAAAGELPNSAPKVRAVIQLRGDTLGLERNVYISKVIPLEIAFPEAKLRDFTQRAYDDSKWENVTKPAERDRFFSAYDGYGWYRKLVFIPESWRGKQIKLNLGLIDDIDETFVNGKKVGATYQWDEKREYSLPLEVVAYGAENLIAVRVYDYQAGGGIYSGPLSLSCGEERINLEGEWRFAVEAFQRQRGINAFKSLEDKFTH